MGVRVALDGLPGVECRVRRNHGAIFRFAKSIMAGIRGYFDHYRPQMPVVQSADSSLIMRDLP